MAVAPKSASGGAFELCPAGSQQLVCVDVVDMGIIDSKWNGQSKPQHKVRLKFQSGLKMKDGKPYLVQRQFTWSMFKSAGLRKFLDLWFGRTFSDQEADAFDFDNLIGMNGWGNITHNQTSRGIFADIQGVMPLPPGMPLLVPTDYVRVVDRPKAAPETAPGPAPAQYPRQAAGAPRPAQPAVAPIPHQPPPVDPFAEEPPAYDDPDNSFVPVSVDDEDLPF